MYARSWLEDRDDGPIEDHIVRLSGVLWQDYERLLEIRGDRSAPRFTYLEGTLEIMSPSRDHERVKSLIGRLLDAFCLSRGIRFSPVGSWTLRRSASERGAEPDECYVFGPDPTDRPDLAIEVVWTSGGLDKLEVYRALGVPEVWVWRKGRLRAHVLEGDSYRAADRSRALPDLDLALLASFLDRPTAYDAVTDYLAALAPQSPAP